MPGYDVDRMWSQIEAITARGIRRPSSPAGLAVEADLAAALESFGYEHVRREPIPVCVWDADDVSLSVLDPSGAISVSPEVQAVPYAAFTPEGGLEGPLRFVASPRDLAADDWRGAIVVADIRFPAINTSLMLKIALGTHDPDGTLAEVNHPATWVRLGWHLYREAVRRGAAGFVGILTNQPGGTCRMFGPYGFREADILDKPIPAVWVGRDDGHALRSLARSGQNRARLTVRGTRSEGLTHNVVAELPGQGADDSAIVLSCHHDSPFVSPVEDASGCAVVLALAERFAAERCLNRRLIILFSAGHFYGSIGTRAFIKAHPDLVQRTALEISIEHIALEAIESADGQLIPTGRPEPSAMFVSFSPTIVEAVLDGVKSEGVDRTILLPAEGPLGTYPPTDGGDWYEAGVPVINVISNPVYLLTDLDALRWIDRPRLPKMAAAFDQILRRLDATPRPSLAPALRWLPKRLLMKAAARLTRAWSTRLGTREFY
jgi:hypothetical protein